MPWGRRSKRQRVKESKSQRDKETKRQRDKESKRQRDKEPKSQRAKEPKRQKDKESKRQRDGGGGVLTTTETTRDNFFASLTHRERGFLKVNGGKGSAKRTMGQRGDVISCFVVFFLKSLIFGK